MRRIVKPRRGGVRRRVAASIAIAVVVALALITAGSASAATMFREAQDIETKSLTVNTLGEEAKGIRKGERRNIGGEAVAVFDINGDGIPDLVFTNGTPFYFVDLGTRNEHGEVVYAKEATMYQEGVFGDEKEEIPKALGLDDLNRDGKLDLYFGNTGDGGLSLKNPRELTNTGPSNIEEAGLHQDNKYRPALNNGNGTFTYHSFGTENAGDTRTPLFADFSGDGRQDQLDFNAPYYGIWWSGGNAPSSLLPGEPNGTFGHNILPQAIVNEKGETEPELFENQYGQGKIDVKGAVVRDFTGNGKPDVVAAAYSDVWDDVETPPLAPANPEGANVDLNHDGIPDGGYQGAWPHGLIALRNVSTPGHIKFINESATAFGEEGLGFGDKMDAYAAIPVDLNHDGKLDLVVIGIRNYTGFNSLEFETPIIKVYKNVSTPEHIRFEDVTAESGLQFMNEPAALFAATGGRYPIELPEDEMQGGGPLILEPNLSAGAAIDLTNDGNPDIVAVDRQFDSDNPRTGEEFSDWTFQNEGDFKFKMIPPSETGLLHTSRDLSYGDLYGNGREDIVAVNGSGGGQTVNDDNYVWKNEISNANNWLELKVRSASDPMGPLGLGAKVTVYRAGTDEILGDEEMRTEFAYRSRRDAILHFGLGSVSAVDVKVEGAELGTPVTVHNVPINELDTITVPPEAPILSGGATPNKMGVFTLSWEGVGGNNVGFTYTLQHKNANGAWTNVATGLTKPEYAFTSGGAEAEGTWSYRVTATYEGTESEPSPASTPVVVDQTPPNAPAALASRQPDYSGGGGWYKNSVEVTFASNGDPNLSDGSPGSGVNPFSFLTSASPQTFDTSGPHAACGTVEDYVGNVSSQGCLTVQVDATPPTLELTCPAMVAIGSSARATYDASDAYSGLANAASGTIPINTSTSGVKTTTYTASSNVGLETTRTCTTYVGYYVVVEGPVKKLIVRDGEADLLTSSAKVSGNVTVQPGGALDVEGAALSGSLKASGAALLRVCSASIVGAATVKSASGSVVLGEGTAGCSASTFAKTVTIKGNTAGVSIDGNGFGISLSVKENSGGVTVVDNKVAKNLTVKGNVGSVGDRPNEVKGNSKLQ
jgi:hypothetical protein